MRLIIAEKPSVARAIADAVGAKARKEGYIEGPDCIVSWCRGHLVDLVPPDGYDQWAGAWDIAKLPMLPETWLWRVLPDSEEQFGVLKGLLARPDMDEVVNACDADREGEGIFRRVMRQAGCSKPMMRLWSTALTPEAIRADLAKMRPESDYDGLGDAAEGRAKADWLVGMNGSRAYASLYRCRLSVGRVQTPTLALVVERTRAAKAFKSKPFFQPAISLGGAAGGFDAFGAKIEDRAEAVRIAEACEGAAAKVELLERKSEKNRAPLLYDLTSLQKDASTVAGLTAEQSLDALQALYEAKLATYPRADSRYIGEADIPGAQRVVDSLVGDVFKGSALAEAFDPSRADVSRVADDSKVHGHGAILPTDALDSAAMARLEGAQLAVMRLICTRLLAAVMEPATRLRTKVELSCCGNAFSASGNVVTDASWIAVDEAGRALAGGRPEGQEEGDELIQAIPDTLSQGDSLPVVAVQVKEGKTAPPKPYTDASLLSAMANAGRRIENRQLREAIDDDASHSGGLGTPATRAATIEKLVADGYIARKGRQLIATDQGCALIDAVADSLKTPELTARWELELSRVESGEAGLSEFMAGIQEYSAQIVEDAKASYDPKAASALAGAESVGNCPKCGRPVVKKGATYRCSSNRYAGPDDGYKLLEGCGFRLFARQCGKELTASQAKSLLAGKTIKLTGLRKRDGTKFDTEARLEDAPYETGNVVFCGGGPKADGASGKGGRRSARRRR